MKIIKEGKLPSQKVHRGQCMNCGAVFEFQEVEARFESFPRNESALVIRCPTVGCKKDVYVSV